MILGPVFRAELLRTARQRRYYSARFFYGLILLLVIWARYSSATAWSPTLTIDQVARFAEDTFTSFAIVQLIAILLLVPALFGGAIADEKQRKTLHYLMASRLSSFEIVLDKVLGRAPHLAVFLALGLPVVSILGLFGGVPAESVAVAYIGTASTAAFAVALTVLVSTLARKVRPAILVAYLAMLAWLLVPPLIWLLGRSIYPATYGWIRPVSTWWESTSPLSVYITLAMGGGWTGNRTAWIFEQVLWMVGLQLAGAAAMILLAVGRLRPAFRRHAEARPARSWFGGAARGPRPRRRIWDRPDCGEDAMGWKERHFARTDAFTRMAVLPATVLVTVVLVLAVGIDESILRTFSDLWRDGFRGWGRGGDGFVDHLRVFSSWYVAIWLLAVAGASASSITVEREEDTWVSLTSTPLTAREILRGKVLGALWAQRGFAAVPLGLWSFGLLIGAVHPLGFLGAVLMFGVVSWLVASVGVHASIRATSTSKALTSTIVTLAVLSGYPLFLLSRFLGDLLLSGILGRWLTELLGPSLGDTYTAFVGIPARLAVGPLSSYRFASTLWPGPDAGLSSVRPSWGRIGIGLVLAAAYASIAAVLTLRVLRRFDAWLDRPRLSAGEGRGLRKPSRPVELAEPLLQS